MKEAAEAAKHVDPKQVELSYFWSHGTQALPRDLLFQSFYGRLGFIIDTPAGKIYPMAALQDVSQVLDALGLEKGDMLARGDTYWQKIPAGTDGYILTFNETTGIPSWQPNAGGGGVNPAQSTLLTLASAFAPGITNWADISTWSATRDPKGAFSAGSPTRITVPSGISLARVTAYLAWSNNGSSGRYCQITHKDSGGTLIQVEGGDIRQAQNETFQSIITPWFSVTPGDYMAVRVNPGSTTASVQPASGFGGPSTFQAEWL